MSQMTDCTGLVDFQDLTMPKEKVNIETSVSTPTKHEHIDPHEDSVDELWYEDELASDASDRDLKKRLDEMHTMGYRDGITKGQNVSAQEGFNIGFKQSASSGYRWGCVRGITSALAALPGHYQEKLVSKIDNRDGFQRLYNAVQAISTNDALGMYNEQLLRDDKQSCEQPDGAFQVTSMTNEDDSFCNKLEHHFKDLEFLLNGNKDIKVDMDIELGGC